MSEIRKEVTYIVQVGVSTTNYPELKVKLGPINKYEIASFYGSGRDVVKDLTELRNGINVLIAEMKKDTKNDPK